MTVNSPVDSMRLSCRLGDGLRTGDSTPMMLISSGYQLCATSACSASLRAFIRAMIAMQLAVVRSHPRLPLAQ